MTRKGIPTNSMLQEVLRDYTYIDSFTVRLKHTDVANWKRMAALFHLAPPWFDVLARLRDKIVGVFGVNTTDGNPKRTRPLTCWDSVSGFSWSFVYRITKFCSATKTNFLIFGSP